MRRFPEKERVRFMNRLTRRSLNLARRTAQSGIDSALTIAARTPGLMTPGLDFSGEKAREARLMVQEKLAAAYEGAWAAQVAWGSFLVKSLFGGAMAPDHFPRGWVDVADAAMAPARRTVRANARRLTGAKRMV
jgi:hypothetical protein